MVLALERGTRWDAKTSWFLAPLGESTGMDSVLASFRRDGARCRATGLEGLDTGSDSNTPELPSRGVPDLRLCGLGERLGELCLLDAEVRVRLRRERACSRDDAGGLDAMSMASVDVVVVIAVGCELHLLGIRELAIDHGFTVAFGGMALTPLPLGLFADLVGCLLCVVLGLVDLRGNSLLVTIGGCFCEAVGSEPGGLRALALRASWLLSNVSKPLAAAGTFLLTLTNLSKAPAGIPPSLAVAFGFITLVLVFLMAFAR